MATLPPAKVTFKSTTGETTMATIDLPRAINRINLSDLPQNPYSEGTATLDLSMGDNRQSFVFAAGVSADGDLTDLGAEPRNIQCFKRVPLFSDGFESGDTSRWSVTRP